MDGEKKPAERTATENVSVRLNPDTDREAYAFGVLSGYRQGVQDIIFFVASAVIAALIAHHFFKTGE